MNNTTSHIKPFGAWKSPISSKNLVQNSLRLGQIQIDSEKVSWTEGRPSEKGRTALMEWSLQNGSRELTRIENDVRTRAHEYGGGAFLSQNGRTFFIQNSDQQLYEILGNGNHNKITDNEKFRYADAELDSSRNCIFLVGEDHSNPKEVKNILLRLALDGSGEQTVIASGHDFYSNPRLSADGRQVVFLSWDHPNMPWDGTSLWLGDLDSSGNLDNVQGIAGGDQESVFQPQWDLNGNIYFVSDKSGWWNIYEYSNGEIRGVLPMEAEFGLPQWVFGMSTYAVLDTGKLIVAYKELKSSTLALVDVHTGKAKKIDVPYSSIAQVQGSGSLISFIGGSANSPSEMVALNLESGSTHVLCKASEAGIDDAFISTPELISYEPRKNEPSYAWFYPPTNPDYAAPEGELPPLIVLSHGGPTAYSSDTFSLTIQYWTTRGFAVVDVNYSGSTGFGREYRERLNGNWGIRDIEDCAGAAQYLADAEKVDADRLIIKGGSAGGYTTLASLAFTKVFKAGASYYGVGDLESLAKDTHKFESRYLDRLVGKYPEEVKLYHDRSPLNHAKQIECPIIFLQGLDDPVVPPNQAEAMVDSLKDKGIPVAYVPFEGESHGFRQATTIVKAIESEFYFYSKIFGIEPADSLEAIEIFNL